MIIFFSLLFVVYDYINYETYKKNWLRISLLIIPIFLQLVLTYLIKVNFEKLKFLTERDFLSKVYNRRFVHSAFPEITQKLNGQKLNIFLLDIDDFKEINDTYGHEAGDLAIQAVSKALTTNTRKMDIVARWGGDEFFLIIPNKEVISTEVILNRIKRNLENFSTEKRINLSISIGRSVYPDDGSRLDELAKLADKKMYKHKFKHKQSKNENGK